MTAKIIDGKQIAIDIKNKIRENVQNLSSKGSLGCKKPGLAVILVGNNPSSEIYVKNKEKSAIEVGFNSFVKQMPENTTKQELLDVIEELNSNPEVNGILLQLPLPKHLKERDFLDKILPEKDADGFNSCNLGKLFKNETPNAIPCTPKGIMKLLEGVKIEGKIACVVGRSNIVGKPVSSLLLAKNATVINAHSKTKNLAEITKTADILISATGKKGLITKDMVKKGAIVIDVGIIRDEDSRLKGDVDFEGVKEVASLITPVPGGVGPMTIAMLLENTFELFKTQKGIK